MIFREEYEATIARHELARVLSLWDDEDLEEDAADILRVKLSSNITRSG